VESGSDGQRRRLPGDSAPIGHEAALAVNRLTSTLLVDNAPERARFFVSETQVDDRSPRDAWIAQLTG